MTAELWITMDKVLFGLAQEHLAACQAAAKAHPEDPFGGDAGELKHAAAAILLACSAMEGHLNWQCRRLLLRRLNENRELVDQVWEGRLERLPTPTKWKLLLDMLGAPEGLSTKEPPLRDLLEAIDTRNAFVAHPKLRPKGVPLELADSPEQLAEAAGELPEVQQITADSATKLLEASSEIVRRLYRVIGDPEVPDWARCALAKGAVRKRKLEALNRHLRTMGLDRWRASFSEIEVLTDSRLPASARKHRPWWAKDASSPGRQSWAWLEAGYRVVDVDLVRGEVTFERSDGRG